MREGLLLLAALFSNIVGLAWLALAMDAHWRQVVGGESSGARPVLMLRVLGTLALALSLWLCLRVDHASMASLVWVMSLAAAALTVAFTMTWRPHWFAVLVGRVRG